MHLKRQVEPTADPRHQGADNSERAASLTLQPDSLS